MKVRKRLGVAAIATALAIVFAPAGAASGLGSWSSPTFVYAASSIQSPGYSYAASAIAGNTERYYTCHSRSSGDVRDHAFLTKRTGGAITSSSSALGSSTSGWDSWHVCDPSVIRVNATFNGQSYSYAMFYLGNDLDCSCHNQVGVAYSNSLDGPWVKYPWPVISFSSNEPSSAWGVGQPSATTIDPNNGTAVLTWTEGYAANTGKMAMVDLDGGTPVVTGVHDITNAGLVDANGNPDTLNNFDIAYSSQRDRFYMVRERHPYPTTNPDYISSAVQILSLPGSDMWNGTGSWTVEGVIDASVTGAARTHNPGFLRTEYGSLPNEDELTVVYTTANLDPGSLWTYGLSRTTAAL
ncbi:hypothetical protein [Agromyces salentinus]|uniref:Uncharacterized protein n=1 Tax=Agromyces salentinus TaxID=269421 RepID=A0ABN2N1E9_9MICO|nr:hypothetical protein [Agromyces salentinus]